MRKNLIQQYRKRVPLYKGPTNMGRIPLTYVGIAKYSISRRMWKV